MISNFNFSLNKLIILTSLSNTALFTQNVMEKSSWLSFSDSKFSHFINPLLFYPSATSSVSFKSCLFTKFQTTSVITPNNIYQHRVFLRFDGTSIPKSFFNLTECIFKYCRSRKGPGCVNSGSCWGYLQHNEFTSNKGKFGGAIYFDRMRRLSIFENQFNWNTADHFGAGYGDVVLQHPIIFYNNNFTHNRGNKWVGAFELDRSYGNDTMHLLIFNGNSADECGAFFDMSQLPQWHSFNMVIFLNNTARRKGGAITLFIFSSRINCSNCVFIGNRCKEGNCIYIETKSIVAYLIGCYFDCSKEQVSYERYSDGNSVQYLDNVYFDGQNIDEKRDEIQRSISPIPSLHWFIG